MANFEIDTSGLENVKFGEEIRKKEFFLRPGPVFLNNGAYGVVPKRVFDVQKRYLDEEERQPDHWFRKMVDRGWDESRQVVADFIGADVEDLVFVLNATTGVNTILRSVKLEPGDAILATSLTYISLRKLWVDMAKNVCPGVEGLVMEIKIPIVSEDAVVQQYDDYLTQHPNVKVVLVDHITSPSSIVMPLKGIAAVCRKHGAMVMVDGAHVPGQLPLNLKELDVDFYTGNMYKWFYTPRPCALLWIKREHHSIVKPITTSWRMGTSLSVEFFNQNTRDHVPFMCARQAVQFYKAIGGMDKITAYTSDLATRGRDLVVKEAGVERMAVPVSMEAPNMRMLRLPGVPRLCLGQGLGLKGVTEKMTDEMYDADEVHTLFGWVDGAIYLRLGVQVHNTLDDFRRLARALKDLLADCVAYEDCVIPDDG